MGAHDLFSMSRTFVFYQSPHHFEVGHRIKQWHCDVLCKHLKMTGQLMSYYVLKIGTAPRSQDVHGDPFMSCTPVLPILRIPQVKLTQAPVVHVQWVYRRATCDRSLQFCLYNHSDMHLVWKSQDSNMISNKCIEIGVDNPSFKSDALKLFSVKANFLL